MLSDPILTGRSRSHEGPDVIVIGAGFYGASLAIHLATRGQAVVLVEREPQLLARASFINQARIHAGYHYPRSFVTASRSRCNAPRFEDDFRECVVDTFRHYYAIGRARSNVTATQFARFCDRVGIPLAPAPHDVAAWFNPALVESVFEVEEHVFDASALRAVVAQRLAATGVDLRLGTDAARIQAEAGGGLAVLLRGRASEELLCAPRVLNCTYSRTNALLAASDLPRLPLKHELTEMLLVDPPDALRHTAITVMCGPFFSLMPFPPRGLHTLSHVRYTPHRVWIDAADGPWADPDHVLKSLPPSHASAMVRDASRYLSAVANCRVVDSLWEIKTVLPRSEMDDSRPILWRADHGLPGLTCVAGAKLDNVYELLEANPRPASDRAEGLT